MFQSRKRGAGRAGKSVHSAQVEPAVPDRSYGMERDGPSRAVTDSHPDNSSGYRKAEERKEAASAQAVNRGPRVTMIEVPDQDDDVAYRQWLKRGSPPLSPKRKSAELPTPPDFPRTTSPPPNEGVGPTCVRKGGVTSPTVSRAFFGRCEGSGGPLTSGLDPSRSIGRSARSVRREMTTPPEPPCPYGYTGTRAPP